MKIKEYLMQAYRIDQRINSKLEQIGSLHDLATKATVTYSDMPKRPNRSRSNIADAIIKIMDLEDETNKDIDKLVDLKTDITHLIKKLDSHKY